MFNFCKSSVLLVASEVSFKVKLLVKCHFLHCPETEARKIYQKMRQTENSPGKHFLQKILPENIFSIIL